jgi:hypothetical protein
MKKAKEATPKKRTIKPIISNEDECNALINFFDITVKLRNHEFNIQMLRNVTFTGTQAVLLACYAAVIIKNTQAAFAIAGFGFIFALLWVLYYRASLYWARYWELKCKETYDELKESLSLEVDLFKGHPIGNIENPPDLVFGGKKIKYRSVHQIIRFTQVAFCVFWLALALSTKIFF